MNEPVYYSRGKFACVQARFAIRGPSSGPKAALMLLQKVSQMDRPSLFKGARET